MAENVDVQLAQLRKPDAGAEVDGAVIEVIVAVAVVVGVTGGSD
jgi:hypothetical protein